MSRLVVGHRWENDGMTHDPMCARSPTGVHYVNTCTCQLIAKVRADERKQAEARVETLRNFPGLITISIAAALAANETWISQL